MRPVILVRHGSTSLAGTFCGHMDPGLDAAGERQAEELAAKLTASRLEAVYSSDLRRAQDTAGKIAQRCGLPHHFSQGLREIAFGEWEGLRWTEIEARFPNEARLWLTEYPKRPAPGGESIDDFEARVLQALRCIFEEARGPVCIVSHGGVIRLSLTRLFGVSEEHAWALTRDYGQMIEVGGTT